MNLELTVMAFLVMCNNHKDADVLALSPQSHNHEFEITTTASAAGATAKVTILVQRGPNFLASLNDEAHWREDCSAGATVALTRSQSFMVYSAPLDMVGMTGMAQTLAAYTNGVAVASATLNTFNSRCLCRTVT